MQPLNKKAIDPKDLGICIPCYTGDIDLLCGCISSIKNFYPDLPICLIPDGDPPISGIVKRYGLQVIKRESVHPALAALSYGYGLTKMIAFWHSPFRYFWHIDADTILLGHPLDLSSPCQGRFICNVSHERVTTTLLGQQYYIPEKVPQRYQEFLPQREELFNTGVFFAERGALNLVDYLDILKHMSQNPGAIFTDQGVLNLMVSKLKRQGALMVERRPLQTIVAVTPLEQLQALWPTGGFSAIKTCSANSVIHWAGPKPRLSEGGPFCEPMTYFRMRHFGIEESPNHWRVNATLIAQEVSLRFLCRLQRSYRLKKIRKMLHL